jgi:hypothetical protein
MPNRERTSGGMGMFLTQAIDTDKMPPPPDATTNIRTNRMVCGGCLGGDRMQTHTHR